MRSLAFVLALAMAGCTKPTGESSAAPAAAPSPEPKWALPTILIEPTVDRLPAGPVSVGASVVCAVSIANKGKEPIQGFNVLLTGISDGFVVPGVAPSSGSFEMVAGAVRARFSHEIAPGESAGAKVMLTAKAAGNHSVAVQFEGHGRVLVNAKDEKPQLVGPVAVVP